MIVVGGPMSAEQREKFRAAVEEQKKRENSCRQDACTTIAIVTDKWMSNHGKGRYVDQIGERVFSKKDCREKAAKKNCVFIS